jgi:hypothetical protein
MNNDKKRTLETAHRKIEELKQNKDLSTRISYELKMSTSSPVQSNITGKPHANAIKAAAQDIRHFTMTDSRIHISKVVRILREEYIEAQDELSAFHKRWKTVWGDRGRDNFGTVYDFNGVELTRKKIVDLWMNGEYMHIDDEKSELVQLLRNTPMLASIELEFIVVLQELAKLLFWLDEKYIMPEIRK